jgi:hypothetical protein
MAQAYMQASMDDAPRHVLKLMTQWLTEMEGILTARQQMMQMQAAQLAAGGATGGAPSGETPPAEGSAPAEAPMQ